ncbi:hypothetical protein [Nocardia cyriacigeorgica]|uniref:hypothetical protein n=1 Tax=Nocardia cyriacigeorgica TaxID=135487 RepID=UPI002453E071|nr:hypothetical protein [Nocardia cyriacigeorgica]
MSRSADRFDPAGPRHPHWITIQSSRTVLVVVHTMTAWNRLADILTVFDSDRRVQLVFTFPAVSDVTGDVERQLADDGALVIPWSQALTGTFDAAIAVHHSGELHRISAPLAVLSHGIGFSKIVRHRDERRATSDELRANSEDRTTSDRGSRPRLEMGEDRTGRNPYRPDFHRIGGAPRNRAGAR